MRVAEGLDPAEASFGAEREFVGMRDKSLPTTNLVACGQPQDVRESFPVLRVVTRETSTAS